MRDVATFASRSAFARALVLLSVRALALAGVLAAGLAAAPPARAQALDTAYVVANTRSALPGERGPSLSFVATADGRVLGHVALPHPAAWVLESRDARVAYVAIASEAPDGGPGASGLAAPIRGKAAPDSLGGRPALGVVDVAARRVLGWTSLHAGTCLDLVRCHGDSTVLVLVRGPRGDSAFVDVVDVPTRRRVAEAAFVAKQLRLLPAAADRLVLVTYDERLPGGGRRPARVRVLFAATGACLALVDLPARPDSVLLARGGRLLAWTHRVESSPNGRSLQGEEVWRNTLYVRDAGTLDSLATLELGLVAPEVAIDARSGALLAVRRASGRDAGAWLARLDGRRWTDLDSLPSAGPFRLVPAGEDSLLVVAPRFVRLVRTSTGAPLAQVALPFLAGTVRRTQEPGILYATEDQGHTLARIDLAAGRVVASATVGRTSAKVANVIGRVAGLVGQMALASTTGLYLESMPGADAGQLALAVPPDANVLAVIDRLTHDLTLVTPDSLHVLARLALAPGTSAVVSSRDRSRFLVGSGTRRFQLFDFATRTLVGDFVVPASGPADPEPRAWWEPGRDRVVALGAKGLTLMPLAGATTAIDVSLPDPRVVAIP